MGVLVQRPGEAGHPGGNSTTYVRVCHRGKRITRTFNDEQAARTWSDRSRSCVHTPSEEMEACPVSTRVKSPANDTPDCIRPLS